MWGEEFWQTFLPDLKHPKKRSEKALGRRGWRKKNEFGQGVVAKQGKAKKHWGGRGESKPTDPKELSKKKAWGTVPNFSCPPPTRPCKKKSVRGTMPETGNLQTRGIIG